MLVLGSYDHTLGHVGQEMCFIPPPTHTHSDRPWWRSLSHCGATVDDQCEWLLGGGALEGFSAIKMTALARPQFLVSAAREDLKRLHARKMARDGVC